MLFALLLFCLVLACRKCIHTGARVDRAGLSARTGGRRRACLPAIARSSTSLPESRTRLKAPLPFSNTAERSTLPAARTATPGPDPFHHEQFGRRGECTRAARPVGQTGQSSPPPECRGHGQQRRCRARCQSLRCKTQKKVLVRLACFCLP